MSKRSHSSKNQKSSRSKKSSDSNAEAAAAVTELENSSTEDEMDLSESNENEEFHFDTELPSQALTQAISVASSESSNLSCVNRETVSALKASASAVENGLALISSLINQHQDLYKEANIKEKKSALNALMNSQLVITFAKAVSDCSAAIRLISGQCNGAKNSSAPTQASNDTFIAPRLFYEIRIVPKTGKDTSSLDIKQIFIEATSNIRIQTHDYRVIGDRCHIKVTKKAYADEAIKAFVKHIHDGTRISTLYSISSHIISDRSVKLVKTKRDIMADWVRWYSRNDEINEELAKSQIALKNFDWCKSQEDIEFIQVNKLPDDYIIIQIFISQSAYDHLLMEGRDAFRVDCGDGITIQAYLEFRVKLCAICCSLDHTAPTCKNLKRCKFCGNNHESVNCDIPTAPICFRCNEANLKDLTLNSPTDHHALHQKCPFIRRQRTSEMLAKKIEATRRINGAQ